jgi:hypothetical protein
VPGLIQKDPHDNLSDERIPCNACDSYDKDPEPWLAEALGFQEYRHFINRSDVHLTSESVFNTNMNTVKGSDPTFAMYPDGKGNDSRKYCDGTTWSSGKVIPTPCGEDAIRKNGKN